MKQQRRALHVLHGAEHDGAIGRIANDHVLAMDGYVDGGALSGLVNLNTGVYLFAIAIANT